MMFFLMDQPSQKQFEDLSQRYEQMDIGSVQSLVKLLRVGSDLLAGFEKMLKGYNLSQARFLVLVVMNRVPDQPVSPSTLADKIGVTRATMTGLLTGLEKEQLILRLPDKEDRRRSQLKLTLKGIQTLEAILPDYYSRISMLMQDITEADQAHLIRILDKVALGIPNLTGSAKCPGNSLDVLPYEPIYLDEIIELILFIQQSEFNIDITADDQPDLNDIPGFYQQGKGNFWVALKHGMVA